jgi:UDP-N-acetylglucosamine acyltransferase
VRHTNSNTISYGARFIWGQCVDQDDTRDFEEMTAGPRTFQGARIHPTAAIDGSAQLGDGITIEAFTVIGPEVIIEDRVTVGPHVQLGAVHPHAPGMSTDPSPREGTIRIGADSFIGSHVLIAGPAQLACNTRIGNGVMLYGPLDIGEGSHIFDLAIIGGPGQYPGRHSYDGRVQIGANVTIREYVLINKPVLTPLTSVGDGCYVMSRTQIDHDSCLQRQVKTGCGVTLGGSVQIGEYAYLGMNAVVHQSVRVGAHAMVGMNDSVMKNVPPFAVLVKSEFTKINHRGLSARGLPASEIDAIEAFYLALSRGGDPQRACENDPRLSVIRAFYSEVSGSPTFDPVFADRSARSISSIDE